MKDDTKQLLFDMLQLAYENGQSVVTIGQIARLHLAGLTPCQIIEWDKKHDIGWTMSHAEEFKQKFCK